MINVNLAQFFRFLAAFMPEFQSAQASRSRLRRCTKCDIAYGRARAACNSAMAFANCLGSEVHNYRDRACIEGHVDCWPAGTFSCKCNALQALCLHVILCFPRQNLPRSSETQLPPDKQAFEFEPLRTQVCGLSNRATSLKNVTGKKKPIAFHAQSDSSSNFPSHRGSEASA